MLVLLSMLRSKPDVKRATAYITLTYEGR